MQLAVLTADEVDDLRGYEAIIDRGRKTFFEVGAALSEIRDQRLYRESYDSFEDYLSQRWQMSRPRAYEYIQAAEVVADLSAMADTPAPENERQARALAAVAPEARGDVWREAVVRNDGAPAPARLVAEVAAELAPDPLPSRAADGTPIVRRDDPADIAKLFGKPAADPAPAAPRVHDEWWTPVKFIEAAHAVMGGIDLDPASCAQANDTVKAEAFYGQADDGLTSPWFGRVWLNPPYSDTETWIYTLLDAYEAGSVTEAIVLVNAKVESAWFDAMWSASPVICLVRGRISFVAGDGGKSQTGYYGQAIAYVGPNGAKFCDVFQHLGRLVTPLRVPA